MLGFQELHVVNWDAVSAVGEIFAVLAIVATLIYLAGQVGAPALPL
jgi:hypothetical protein